MRRRARHLRQMSGHAWVWARSAGGRALAFGSFFGVCGLTLLVAVVHAPLWVVAAGLGLVLLVSLEEGSFRAWDETDSALALATKEAGSQDALIGWLRDQTVTVCAAHTTTLAEVCRALTDTLTMWCKEQWVWIALRNAFPCPEAGIPNKIGVAMSALIARDLVEESRHHYAETRSRWPIAITGATGMAASQQETVDASYSEFRWTALGREVTNRLKGSRP